MKNPLFVLGTRPEAIKLLPVMTAMRDSGLRYTLLNTRQHGDIVLSVLNTCGVTPDIALDAPQQADLAETKANMLRAICRAADAKSASAVIVQGDTLSALVGAEYGFLNNIPVCHVEAGMRTFDMFDPYPEESFRKAISAMASVHFCPSSVEKDNLIAERIDGGNVYVTGNTFVDYRLQNAPHAPYAKRQILITLHRRENIPYLKSIVAQIRRIATDMPDYVWLFPVHPNPAVVAPVTEALRGSNVTLCPPLDADAFYAQLLASELVITDSGGVHEECLINRKKALVIRKRCERRTDFDFIEPVDPASSSLAEKFYALLDRRIDILRPVDCYGNGTAASEIVKILINRGLICKA